MCKIETANRFEFIDCCKGLGVFLVLILHVHNLVFYCGERNLVTHGMHLFFMPLFFLASGYVCYKIFTEKISFKRFFSLKMYALLFPFVFFGGAHSFLLAIDKQASLNVLTIFLNFMRDNVNEGYWFILVLFVIRYVSYIGSFVVEKWLRGSFKIKIVLSLMLNFCVGMVLSHYVPSLGKVVFYVPFFILGSLFRVKHLHEYIIKREFFCGFLLIVSLTIYGFLYVQELKFKPLLWFVMQIIPTVYVFNMIYMANPSNKIKKFFCSVGTKSLDIYVLHFFVLLGFKPGMLFFLHYDILPLFAQCTLLVIFALIILLFTMVISKMFNSNTLLRVCMGKFV